MLYRLIMRGWLTAKTIWIAALGCNVSNATTVFAADESFAKTSTIKDPCPEHISVSHTEGKGLGYSKGYSSLDVFWSQPYASKKVVPYVDLRGHIFNDGKYAANAGFGFRYLSDCYKQVWGGYAMYDYLQTSKRPYNQVGAGLEVLGENWDVRINGYVPVGKKKTNIYRFYYEDFDGKGEGDPGLGLGALNLPGFAVKAREQFALNGVDTLAGYHLCRMRFLEFHVGAGPYYYWGNSAKTTNAFRSKHKHSFGGRFAIGLSFLDYVFLEGLASYDALFKWTGQGTLVLSLPFDLTFRLNKSKKNSACSESSYCLKKRLYQPALRNEIIAVDSINRFSTSPQILDPEYHP